MSVFVARQAIFNRKQNVVAYELLFRNSAENFFPDIEEGQATARLIMENQLNLGTRHITSGKTALINIGPDSLKHNLCDFLPCKDVVIELLETIEPTDDNYQLCRELFHKNYKLALDDFVYNEQWERFLKFIKLVKFDIAQTPLSDIAEIVEKLKQHKKIKILAEKIETQADYHQAHKMGFDYFQGYFFAKPTMHEQQDIDYNYALVVAIYAQVMKPSPDIKQISALFEADAALAYKLMRLINSGVFPIQSKISSIKQALVYLGHERLKKFVSLIVTAHTAGKKPAELMQVCVVRARFCELIAKQVSKSLAGEAFLTGLFSLLDAILDQPMSLLVEKLPFPDDIKAALLNEKNTLYYILNVVQAYETGSWWTLEKAVILLNVKSDVLPGLYNQAVDWADNYKNNS
ncbi:MULTISPECIES: EAL and HDOD domain-containing protein [Pseudoalteromonas]|uniref:EAL and HDOD domain-containing protein n=1 Tax=Pseudoalteromonas TaxID=53246 RepID=UPI0003F771F1|nr:MULTISPECIES: HDOD domain-containing protein [Pseudoalteromonas]MCK8117158.1 HDOD domain-containing protein [Pseudoalteromonas sp. 2CM37A]MDY6887481.1 HDOD domain-containing protein [Pseudomonadota bacterium]AZN34433.1 HDOD domain-containing protein [Pseudoalteromonas sp. Xi13]KPZ63007.1 putative cyclic-di-GMP phosphodiesterase AdrB [Pseudoalteromonas sp. P1-7a]MCW1718094.1 HDOD domain-containing protein [Pseudoalteromonas sp. A3]